MKILEKTATQSASVTALLPLLTKLKVTLLAPLIALLLFAVAHAATDTDGDGIMDADEGAVVGDPLNIINNRGFESPVIATGTFSQVDVNTVDNWNTTATCSCIEIWADGFRGRDADQGDQFIELNAENAQNIFQTLQVPAAQATISYGFSHRGRNTVDNMNMYIGVNEASKELAISAATGPASWARYEGEWVKPAGATTIYVEFRSLGAGSVGNFLDNIVVNTVSLDTDADGEPDFLDADSDNDGIADNIELTVDADSDGIPDFQDADSTGAATLDNDGDGLSNLTELTAGTDPSNPDTDGDGLDDGAEVNTFGTDPNNPDTDGGGTNDGAEVAIGSDPLNNNSDDGQDSDSDGLSDAIEITLGTDPANTDSDADGLSDGEEVNTFATNPDLPDTDGDGLDDGFEVNTSLTDPDRVDTDSDGLDDGSEVDIYETDPLSEDTDADGLSDGEEVNTFATDPNNPDTDNGGAPDGDEVLGNTNPADPTDDLTDLDSDNDGIPNSVEGGGDQDNDGIVNYLDLDSDNDGITDTVEAGGSDADGDGIVDDFTDINNDGFDDQSAANPLLVPDTDGDGLADYLDVDSDQDGLSDIFEAGGIDADDDGKVDNFTDVNGDGLADSIATAPLPLHDSDADGQADYLDLDSDNDGTSDLVESGGADVDGNGVIDTFLDTDNDGIPDQADVNATGGTDSDADGIVDIADTDLTAGADVNGNGIVDSFEADPDGDGRDAIVASDVDSLPDADSDGIPDVLDSDRVLGLITGVSGTGVGCSILPGQPSATDPLLPLVLLTFMGLIARRAHRRR